MSKVGRISIDIANVSVDVKGQEVHYKGSKGSGVYSLPGILKAEVDGMKLALSVNESNKAKLKKREINRIWGMHRALLNNTLQGARELFQKNIEINGLGYKATASGSKLVFALGYSHKIDFELPKEVSIVIDKSGQKLQLTSSNKQLLGQVCSNICFLRLPEPYKGTGIKLDDQVILRKAGKTK